jgi:repressor LexA
MTGGPSSGAQALRRERTVAGLTLEELADRIGCSKALLSQMESGQRSISIQRARAVERALKIRDGRLSAAIQWDQTPPAVRTSVSRAQRRGEQMALGLRHALASRNPIRALRKLVDQADDDDRGHASPLPPHKFHGIPVINKVAAGYPREFTDLDYPRSIADEYIACPDVSDPDAFGARVVGDSMAPEYREGDIVVFSPLLDTPPGCDCFIRFERDNETTFKRVYFEEDGRMIRLQPLNNAYAPRMIDREDVAGMYAAVYVMRKVRPVNGGREREVGRA